MTQLEKNAIITAMSIIAQGAVDRANGNLSEHEEALEDAIEEARMILDDLAD